MDRIQPDEKPPVTALQQHVRDAMQAVSFNELADSLGYQNRARLFDRIQTVVTDPMMGIEGSLYDYKYSSTDFVRTLCQSLGIDADAVEVAIQDVEAQRDVDRETFKSYVFVDTGFRHTTEPIHVLAAVERLRRIPLCKDVRRLALYQQIDIVRSLVRDHYRQCEGTLLVWGKIKQYVFQYADDQHVVFYIDGTVTNTAFSAVPSQAVVTVGGKDFDNLGISPAS